MNEFSPVKEALDSLFFNALNSYGDVIEKFWIYESEICPCCNTRKIDTPERKNSQSMSLNSFMYRDMNVLIAYFLCSKCIFTLIKKGQKGIKEYKSIEETSKKAYCDSLITSVS
jgi:hypothetical protein